MEQGLHGAAVGVAADNDVLDLERGDGVLDDGGDAAEHFAVGGNHVADVARDEDFAGAGLGEGLGIDAGVGAGDDQGVRLLRGAACPLVGFGVGRVDLRVEVEDAGFQALEGFAHGRDRLRGA